MSMFHLWWDWKLYCFNTSHIDLSSSQQISAKKVFKIFKLKYVESSSCLHIQREFLNVVLFRQK